MDARVNLHSGILYPSLIISHSWILMPRRSKKGAEQQGGVLTYPMYTTDSVITIKIDP